MKLATITATLALLTSSALASPNARQFEALITFHGATPQDTFTQAVPTDGTLFYVCKSMTFLPYLASSLASPTLLLFPLLSPSITILQSPPILFLLAVSSNHLQSELKLIS